VLSASPVINGVSVQSEEAGLGAGTHELQQEVTEVYTNPWEIYHKPGGASSDLPVPHVTTEMCDEKLAEVIAKWRHKRNRVGTILL
jgi:hypothetical protein